jgi:dTDP-4-dehydrorhamnose reductase
VREGTDDVSSAPLIVTPQIWVIGRTGQIGRALVEQLGARAVAIGSSDFDLSNYRAVPRVLDELAARHAAPAAIVNAAAYTRVDDAEANQAVATAVNAAGPGAIARWCAARDVPFVHYSTDYVYPGTGETPWREDDATGPLNAYGRSKLEGDCLIAASGARYLVLRTSWVYDAIGRNFFNTMMRLCRERDTLRVVADQVGAPTYAPHAAAATLSVLTRARAAGAFPSGVYHLVNRGHVSWHGFARAIVDQAARTGLGGRVGRVEPIASSQFPTPAARPLNSRLDSAKLERVFGERLPDWQAGVAACMDEWVRTTL